MPGVDEGDAAIVEILIALISGKQSEFKERQFFTEHAAFVNPKCR